jgi:hypothetical protein
MRQIVPLASSDTSRAPSLATATPTGRPHTVLSLTTKPVKDGEAEIIAAHRELEAAFAEAETAEAAAKAEKKP